MSSPVKQFYEFGAFRLDAREKTLWCEGKLVPLTPKLIETLLVLVEGEGRIVTKQELMERVWPDTYVEEGNLARHVSLLRKTLGAWTDDAALIETLPRRGYRFAAPLRQPAESISVPAIAPPQELIVATLTVIRVTEEEQVAAEPPALPRVSAPMSFQLGERRVQSLWVVGAVAIVALVGLWLMSARRSTALTEKDTLLLADFANRTGDPVFDGTLRQGLAVQLEQSPFLNFLPEQRVRDTLVRMTRSPDERITAEVGREICLRQGVKALITGDIAPLGSHYVITLEAMAGSSGATLARAQREAAGKEGVLGALSLAANDLRRQLGESLKSLQKFDALLEQTTSSLPALQNFTMGMALNNQGKPFEAVAFLQRAVELDPHFATAWATRAAFLTNTAQHQEAAASIRRAYALRDRASELERFRIDMWYHYFATRDLEQAIEVLEQFRRTYPRAPVAHNTLARVYLELGQWALAEAPAREFLRLNPASTLSQQNMAETLLYLNHLDESRALLGKLRESGAVGVRDRNLFYRQAYLDGDEAAQQREIEQLRGGPHEYQGRRWQAAHAAYRGQAQDAREALRQAVKAAARPQLRGVAAHMLARAALDLAVLCQGASPTAPCDISHLTEQALALERSLFVLSRSGLALALHGKRAQALALEAETQRLYPQGTLSNAVWRPLLRAVLARQPAQVIELLSAAERYETGASFWPQYLRGVAYLQQQSPQAALAEFQKIVSHREYEPLSPLFALAHLELARAAALNADTPRSRQAYQDFFTLWQDADANLPVLKQARQEYAALP